MQETRSSAPSETHAIGCHRCDGQASIRRGKVFLCPRCAVADSGASSDSPLILCDVCDGESLVRFGERFMCARCALAALFVTANDVEVLGRPARERTMRLVDVAADHHQALSRSMKRARDPLECVQRVDAGAVQFDVWASSFDARQEELERRNDVLVRISEELDRQVEELCGERDEMRRALRRAAADRRRGVRSLIATREEERRRNTPDHRDDALQALEAVLVRLESIRRDEVDGGRPEELEMTTMLCLGRLRRFLFELRSGLLDRYGIADTLRRFLDRTAEQSGLVISLENRLTGEPETRTRTNLYRILQEAVVNVRKHSRARRADVTMEENDGGILVTVRDDGIGFSPETMSASGQHLGFEAMRLRAEASGGWLRVDSAPGKGTRVMTWVPKLRTNEVSQAVIALPSASVT